MITKIGVDRFFNVAEEEGFEPSIPMSRVVRPTEFELSTLSLDHDIDIITM